jgi:hypothetical protein
MQHTAAHIPAFPGSFPAGTLDWCWGALPATQMRAALMVISNVFNYYSPPAALVLDAPVAALDAETKYALFERYTGAARRVHHDRDSRITILVSTADQGVVGSKPHRPPP